MFVYLDESGDAGFKFDRNSSRYFVVALLLVDDPIPLHLDFTARAIVVDKMKIPDSVLRERETFYRTIVQHALSNDGGRIQDATLILDESFRGRKAKNEFTVFLRRSLNADTGPQRVRRVRYHASHTDNLIQAADKVAGAIHARYHRGDDRYIRLIRPKIQDPRDWKPNLRETQ